MEPTTRTTQTESPIEIILAALKEQGRSQTWLALRLGMNFKTLNAYLLGRRSRSQDEIAVRASRLLGDEVAQKVDSALLETPVAIPA